jgi:hypothetical protein
MSGDKEATGGGAGEGREGVGEGYERDGEGGVAE